MFGFGKNKKPKNVSDIRDLNDIKMLIKTVGESRAGEVIRQNAQRGNLVCQIFMSQAGIYLKQSGLGGSTNQDAEMFTKMGAESGDPGSQFNLAKMLMDKLDSEADSIDEEQFNLIASAKFWHRKAAAQGFRPSIEALKDLNAFPDTWAEMVNGAE